MPLEDLKDLLIDELRDTLSAEKQLLKALPKMAKAASSPILRKGFEKHLRETEKQVERLNKVFKLLEETPRAKTCKAMQGLIEEAADIIEEDADRATKDAALIAAAQKVEHYEIAAYGTMATWAKLLDYKKVLALLVQTLEEEKATDIKLTEVAEKMVNEASMT